MGSNDSTPSKNTNIADVTSNVSQSSNQTVIVQGQGQCYIKYEEKVNENASPTNKIGQLEKDLEKANELSEQMRKENKHLKEQVLQLKTSKEHLLKENRLLEQRIENDKEVYEKTKRDLNAKITKVNSEVAKVQSQLKKFNTSYQEEIKSHGVTKQALEDQKAQQEKDTAFLAQKKDEEIEGLTRQVAESKQIQLRGAQGAEGGWLSKLFGLAIGSDPSFDLTRALRDLKINLVDGDGQGSLALKTRGLEEKVWTVCKLDVRGVFCSFSHGIKTIFLEKRPIESNLKIIDSKYSAILKNESLNITFTPDRMLVKSDTAFILGEKNNGPCVARLDLIKSTFILKLLPYADLIYSNCELLKSALFPTDDCLYILYFESLFKCKVFKCNVQTLEHMECICEFTNDFEWPTIFVQDKVMTIFSKEGNLTVDLDSAITLEEINSEKSKLWSFPGEDRVSSICEYQGGLALALSDLRDDAKIKVGWYKPSRNHKEALGSFQLISTLSLDSSAPFYEVYLYGRITC